MLHREESIRTVSAREYTHPEQLKHKRSRSSALPETSQQTVADACAKTQGPALHSRESGERAQLTQQTKTKGRSDITPSPGGHPPQRPYAQGRTLQGRECFTFIGPCQAMCARPYAWSSTLPWKHHAPCEHQRHGCRCWDTRGTTCPAAEVTGLVAGPLPLGEMARTVAQLGCDSGLHQRVPLRVQSVRVVGGVNVLVDTTM